MSQTKNFSSATLESEKGFILFSEEKKKRGTQKKIQKQEEKEKEQQSDEEGWKAFELISLYAVHKEVNLEARDFWTQVAARMRSKGHSRSAEDCKMRWDKATIGARERSRAKRAAASATDGDKLSRGASPEPSEQVQASTRSSPRLQAVQGEHDGDA